MMCRTKLHLMAAACENMGIGVNGTLPWRLKNELQFFTDMTSNVSDPSKHNVVIMGRRTWDSIPKHRQPLPDRINIVITRNVDTIKEKVPADVIVVPSLDEAVKYIESREDIEKSWVIGGSAIYKAAMEHPNCGKIYLTEIQKTFECDTFFPAIDKQQFKLSEAADVPSARQEEGDITYYYRVYEKV